MKWLLSILCKLKERTFLLLFLGFLLLVILFLLRHFFRVLLFYYFGFLILLGLIGLVKIFQRVLKKLCQKASASPKGSGSEGQPNSKPVYVPASIYKHPDPMIYSQYYLMSKGIGVTWDNPDIQLFDGLTPIPSHGLTPGKTYIIQARIFNGSVDAAAVNMPVKFYYLSFGIGAIKKYLGQTLVNVPVKGAAGLPVIASFPWTTPLQAGHYCIQVELDWPDDANPYNNLGQENVDVKKLNSPNATFTFLLRNDSVFARTIRLQADSYALPPKDPCTKNDPATLKSKERITLVDPYAKHRLPLHPIAKDWKIDYHTGNEFQLQPGEEQNVSLTVTAFDTFTGRQVFNINAFHEDKLIGGVTLYAHS